MLPHGHRFPEKNVFSNAPHSFPLSTFHSVYGACAANSHADRSTTRSYFHPKLHLQRVECADTINDALRLNR